MKPTARRVFTLALAACFAIEALSVPLFACEGRLTPASIREAYSLGRKKNVKTALFLKRYSQDFPPPGRGPHIAVIQLETPYMLVVKRSGETPNYEGADAEKDFLGKPEVFRFTVRIDFTPSYSHVITSADPGVTQERPPDFWKDFQIRVMQGEEVTPARVIGKPTYSGTLDGAIVTLEFDAEKFQCVPSTVDVFTPDGQHVFAQFDLSKLR